MWRRLVLSLGMTLLGTSACGSAQKGEGTGPGQPQADAGEVASVWGGGVDASDYGAGGGAEGADAGAAPTTTTPAPPTAPTEPTPFAFELVNEGAGELHFAVDKGWQPVIFAYTGKPPKAKSALLFGTFCTASCDAPLTEICPVCTEETEDLKKRRQQELAETKREIAPAGGKVTVGWDGKLFVYEKAPKEAKRRGCKCWRKVDPPADTYTVKACGLRPATKAGEATRPVCAETQIVLPLPAGTTTIPLRFAK